MGSVLTLISHKRLYSSVTFLKRGKLPIFVMNLTPLSLILSLLNSFTIFPS